MVEKEEIRDWFTQLQLDICKKLEETDGKSKFISDVWERPGGGGG
ncbi:MAG: coproporphyrinogen III oxidase, partial [Marivirga sp.]|nr:coproporphyrinogen III oxidase [Marivirga sp.]